MVSLWLRRKAERVASLDRNDAAQAAGPWQMIQIMLY
jgi:hypothetical protein